MSARIGMDDLVRMVSTTHGLTLSDSRSVLLSTFCMIKDSVSKGDKVSISKFGVFSSVLSKAYTARNPKTGEPVAVPAKNRVKFQAFDDFKSKVEG